LIRLFFFTIFKALYKKLLLAHVFADGIWDIDELPKPTPAQGIRWLVSAWNDVSKVNNSSFKRTIGHGGATQALPMSGNQVDSSAETLPQAAEASQTSAVVDEIAD